MGIIKKLNRPHFILDNIAAAPNSAYSLRRLRSAYLGPLISVRRSSDSAAANIYGTPNGDLDVPALLAFVGTGSGFVSIWYDQSGSGNNATEATAASQPQIVSSGVMELLSNIPAVRFNNTGSVLSTLIAHKFAAPSTNWSYSMVGSADNMTGNNFNVFGSDTNNAFNNSGAYHQITTVNFSKSGSTVGSVGPSVPANGTAFSFICTYSAANSSIAYVNGLPGTPASISYSNGTLGAWQMGVYVTPPGTANLAGYISEHIAFSSVLSVADQKNLEFSQANYYKLAVSL